MKIANGLSLATGDHRRTPCRGLHVSRPNTIQENEDEFGRGFSQVEIFFQDLQILRLAADPLTVPMERPGSMNLAARKVLDKIL